MLFLLVSAITTNCYQTFTSFEQIVQQARLRFLPRDCIYILPNQEKCFYLLSVIPLTIKYVVYRSFHICRTISKSRILCRTRHGFKFAEIAKFLFEY